MRIDVWQAVHSDLAPGVQPDQESFAAPLGDRQVLLPIRTLPDGGRGVASLILNQASFAVLDALADDHRSYVTVAIGCTGGQHRSVFLVEQLARAFGDRWAALKRHRELDTE